jgi:RNA 3'-terminal phosphate cyclase (ATP)
MIEIDGSKYSGSGTIVRQAVTFAALTGQPVHIINARVRRPKPGLRAQHLRVVKAIGELVQADIEGLSQGSQELLFRPGALKAGRRYVWDIGSAGSTTMLALAVLPVLAFASGPVSVELRGGLFQDFAPSLFHLQHVMLPLLRRMGLHAEAEMGRPGYVPRGEGILHLTVKPVRGSLGGLCVEHAGPVDRIWGIALASHLEQRKVSHRMAEAANKILEQAGYHANIDERNDTESLQSGAALGLFADLAGEVRLGADQAGALRRPAEAIGKHVAKQLLEEFQSGATLDRFAADQIIPFAALATGNSRFRVPVETDHVSTNVWLARTFLDAEANVEDHLLSIAGIGFRPPARRSTP